ncbi:hypothetical protein OKA04_19085 [Luteolibacter flavescens]|uniref:Uncharacterized protein n=1 Tax=Luteolibacter flavescens TaxID=1859460 RepID=A0ABT3FTF9_9BACT|nr:hypothetical protein [Luteolibacter flavescens]MCW1886853.1 hypothetical protein [Luteolibacter flavescens]
MNYIRRDVIKLGLASAFVGVSSAQDGLQDVSEDRAVSVKLDAIKGKKLKIKRFVDEVPDVALEIFFKAVKDQLNVEFWPLLEEQKNPISFARRASNRHNRVNFEEGEWDAYDLFDVIIVISKWSWYYSKEGNVVIRAWHQGDLADPEK